MTPQELTPYLSGLVGHGLQLSLMLWGPPGIGKSSIVAEVAAKHELQLVDLRLSQLAPTDLRGLPVCCCAAWITRAARVLIPSR